MKPDLERAVLGLELGSTRIKAVLIDENHRPIASGDYAWENRLENGIWTYDLEEVIKGLRACYRALADDVEQSFGQVDVLFNNAGVMLPSMEIERMPVEEWKATFDINISGMFYVTRYLKPLLVKVHGNMINNASIAGLQHYAAGRSYAYSASKAAVIQFSHQMAKNYGEEGVRVNCICPGIIDTPILGDRDRKVFAERVPLGYLGKPEDVAKVVAFLASEDAAYLTGVVLPIDGGVSL